MIDNIPAWIAIPLAVILWVFLIQMIRVDARRAAREEAEQIQRNAHMNRAAADRGERFLKDMGIGR